MMRRKLHMALWASMLLALCVSCKRTDVSILAVQPVAVLRSEVASDGALVGQSMALSVFADLGKDVGSGDLQFAVVSPDGTFRWEFVPYQVQRNGTQWLGNSALVLGSGMPLPIGMWSLHVLMDDGRAFSTPFEVSYRHAATDEALPHVQVQPDGVELLGPANTTWAVEIPSSVGEPPITSEWEIGLHPFESETVRKQWFGAQFVLISRFSAQDNIVDVIRQDLR